jgi:hypothetical protein
MNQKKSRRSKIRRTPVQAAMVELRARLGLSQQDLSNLLGVGLPSVGRWETREDPAGIMLANLRDLATKHGHGDLAAVFVKRLNELVSNFTRSAIDVFAEIQRWDGIKAHLDALIAESKDLKRAGNPAGERIHNHVRDLSAVLDLAKRWSWRNR